MPFPGSTDLLPLTVKTQPLSAIFMVTSENARKKFKDSVTERDFRANLKWHMPIWGEICNFESKYILIFGTIA